MVSRPRAAAAHVDREVRRQHRVEVHADRPIESSDRDPREKYFSGDSPSRCSLSGDPPVASSGAFRHARSATAIAPRFADCTPARAIRRRSRRAMRAGEASNCSIATASPVGRAHADLGVVPRVSDVGGGRNRRETQKGAGLQDLADERTLIRGPSSNVTVSVGRRDGSRTASADHQHAARARSGGPSRRSARWQARDGPRPRRPPLPASAPSLRRRTTRADRRGTSPSSFGRDAADQDRIRQRPLGIDGGSPCCDEVDGRSAADRRRTRPARGRRRSSTSRPRATRAAAAPAAGARTAAWRRRSSASAGADRSSRGDQAPAPAARRSLLRRVSCRRAAGTPAPSAARTRRPTVPPTCAPNIASAPARAPDGLGTAARRSPRAARYATGTTSGSA